MTVSGVSDPAQVSSEGAGGQHDTATLTESHPETVLLARTCRTHRHTAAVSVGALNLTLILVKIRADTVTRLSIKNICKPFFVDWVFRAHRQLRSFCAHICKPNKLFQSRYLILTMDYFLPLTPNRSRYFSGCKKKKWQ